MVCGKKTPSTVDETIDGNSKKGSPSAQPTGSLDEKIRNSNDDKSQVDGTKSK